jgi:hypothetical protein
VYAGDTREASGEDLSHCVTTDYSSKKDGLLIKAPRSIICSADRETLLDPTILTAAFGCA